MLRITTASGAQYLLDLEEHRVRRVNSADEKRGDGEFQTLISYSEPMIGSSMVLIMESLSRYGQDDHGTAPEDVTPYTTRMTTPVVSITEED